MYIYSSQKEELLILTPLIPIEPSIVELYFRVIISPHTYGRKIILSALIEEMKNNTKNR